MIIKSIHIYGFGRFSNVQFNSFDEQLQVIYGENESGKTTLMACIRAILFGFPTKKESELRYEPKLATSYGGKLTLETKRHGQVVIERVRGKARGDVTVYLEDGTSGDEQLLQHVLEGLDRNVYEAIFSFSSQDIQYLDTLKSEEMGAFLYRVGMAGKWNVSELEKEIEQQQGKLFKPSGRRPLINEQLKKLQTVEHELREKEAELQEERQMIDEQHEVEEKLANIETELEKVRTKLAHEERLHLLAPLVEKRQEVMLQLEKLPDLTTFPRQGVQTFTALKGEEKQLADRSDEVDAQLQPLLKKVAETHVDEEILKHATTINELHATASLYRDWKFTYEKLTNEVNERKKQVTELLRTLGDKWDETGLLEAVTTLEAKEQLLYLQNHIHHLKERRACLNIEIEQKERHVADRKRAYEQMKEKQWTEAELKQLAERNERVLEAEMKLKEKLLNRKNDRKQPLLFTFLLLFFTVVLTITGLKSYWLLFSIIAIAFFVVLFIVVRQSGRLKKKLSHSEQQQALATVHEIELEKQSLEAKRNEVDSLQQQLLEAKKSYNEMHASYENDCLQMERLDANLNDYYERLQRWCIQMKFPRLSTASLALSVFDHVVRGQQLLREVNETEREMQRLKERVDDYEKRVRQFDVPLTDDDASSMLVCVEKLVEELRQHEQQQLELTFINEQIEAFIAEKERLSQKRLECVKKIEQLLRQAHAESEEAFIEKGVYEEEKWALEKELRLLDSQLEVHVNDRQRLEKIMSEMNETTVVEREEKKRKLSQLVDEYEEEVSQLKNRLFASEAARKKLFNESEFVRAQQQLEVEKAHLKEIASEWAMYEVAKQMIKRAKAIYEEKRQPEVMRAAQHWFSKLTCGEYVRLFAPIDAETITVERKDGVRFLPEELSKGTKEQLYFALRIALAEAYRSETVFPVIIDDLFVNFDDERKKAATHVLMLVAKKRQVIVFTCHKHVKELFSSFSQKHLTKATQ